MEANTVKCRACSKTVVPNLIKSLENPLPYFECNECKNTNFGIKCPSCSELTISLNDSDLYPGTKIRCRNANCAAVFQYISCPMLNCRKHNYFKGDLVIGNVWSCACETSFQDIPCPNCGVENYFGGTPEHYYNTGVPLSCRSCQIIFLHLTCPHCKEAISPGQDYRAGEKIKCGACQKSFQQTNCPGCKKPKYYLQCELKVGTKEICSCSKAYKTCLCPDCSMVDAMLIESANQELPLQEIVPRTCTSCPYIYEHIPCPTCSMAFYVPSELRSGKSDFECLYCKKKSIHLFNCQFCRKRYFNREQEITACPAGCVIQEEPKNEASQFSKEYSKMQLGENKESGPPLSEDKLCTICMANEKKIAFSECGHFNFCLKCSDKIMKSSGKCPICNEKITKCQRIYS